MTKKTILIVTGRAFNAWRARLPLAKLLRSDGCSVIIAASGDDYYNQKIKDEGINFVHVPFFRYGFKIVSELKAFTILAKFLHINSVDICHAFNPKPIFMLGIILRFFPKIIFFITVTGLGDFSGSSIKNGLIKFAYRFAMKRASHVCVENQHDYDFVLSNKLVSQDKCKIGIASGVDSTAFPIKSIRDPKLPIKFVFASRLLKSKGLLEFLAASEKIKLLYGNRVSIVLAGEDETGHPSAVSLDEIKVYQNSGIIKYVGALSSSEVCLLLKTTDIAVLPSYREGFSKFLMEGAAAGCALISTDIPGCREIVVNGKTGLTVPLGSSGSLFDAMKYYLDFPSTIAEHGQSAQMRARKKYDFKIIAAKNSSIYSSGINKKNL